MNTPRRRLQRNAKDAGIALQILSQDHHSLRSTSPIVRVKTINSTPQKEDEIDIQEIDENSNISTTSSTSPVKLDLKDDSEPKEFEKKTPNKKNDKKKVGSSSKSSEKKRKLNKKEDKAKNKVGRPAKAKKEPRLNTVDDQKQRLSSPAPKLVTQTQNSKEILHITKEKSHSVKKKSKSEKVRVEPAHPGIWRCDICTYDNPGNHRRCEQCYTKKPLVVMDAEDKSIHEIVENNEKVEKNDIDVDSDTDENKNNFSIRQSPLLLQDHEENIIPSTEIEEKKLINSDDDIEKDIEILPEIESSPKFQEFWRKAKVRREMGIVPPTPESNITLAKTKLKDSQSAVISEHISSERTVTSIQALKVGSHLASVDIEREGKDIAAKMSLMLMEYNKGTLLKMKELEILYKKQSEELKNALELLNAEKGKRLTLEKQLKKLKNENLENMSLQKSDTMEDHTSSQILSIVASAATSNNISSTTSDESSNSTSSIGYKENKKLSTPTPKKMKPSFVSSSLCREIKSEPKVSYSTRTVKPNTVPFKFEATFRKKDERRILPGHACEHCNAYVDVICRQGADKNLFDKQDFLNMCSRHRNQFSPDPTPEDFWELSFQDSIRKKAKSSDLL